MKKLILSDGALLDPEFLDSIGFPSVLAIITESEVDYEFAQTSIQDTGDYGVLNTILLEADSIYIHKLEKLNFPSLEQYSEFILWIKRFKVVYKNKIVNNDMLFSDPYGWYRKTTPTKKDIVFLGCSWTDNTWVKEDDKFSSIVSNKLNLNCFDLARRGSSNHAMFERFLQTEFVEGQLVVWQLTSLSRLVYCCDNNRLTNIMLSTDKSKNIDALMRVYTTNQIFYETLMQVEAVVNIARAKKLKLVIFLKDYKQDWYETNELMYLSNFKEFTHTKELEDCLVDFGSDNLHPGVETNKIYAQEILKHLEILYT
tara:strand:- start:50 stop:988 length:939 start_codon:yes stop_codon:yes gene_type:complete